MSTVKITIEYQELNRPNWQIFKMSPSNYFDCGSNDENITWESVPLFNHAFEYLPIEKKNIQATKLIINDESNKVIRKVCEYFWHEGSSQIIEVIDEGLNINRHEIIINLLFSDIPNTTQIIRCHKENGLFKPSYIGLITENIDGVETEKKMY